MRAAQASAAGDPAGDEYLDALAKETLRIRPVMYDVGRVLTEPIELAGYRLPAGVMVAPGDRVGTRERRAVPGSRTDSTLIGCLAPP